MATTKISSKYQVVIPGIIREKSHLDIGQTMQVYSLPNGDVLLSTRTPLERAREYFVGKNLWDEDPVVARHRESAEYDAKQERLYGSLS